MNPDLGIHNSESRIPDLDLVDLSPFEREGFQVIAPAVSGEECEVLASELSSLFDKQKEASTNRVAGVRNLLRLNASVAEFARSQRVLRLLERAASAKPFPVRAIFFDKNPGANWLVPWHQDLAIPVVEKIETPGFTGWSIKDGVQHVHPPQSILESMITLRLHLDDCSLENGALKVIPGSHSHGKIALSEIPKMAKFDEVICEVPNGGVLLMRPLILHGSLTAHSPLHSRILHIEYATQPLPNGLQWKEN